MKCEFIKMAEYQSLRRGILGANVSSVHIQNTNVELISCAWKFKKDTYSHRGRCNFVSDFASMLSYLSFKWQKAMMTIHRWRINLNVLSLSPIIFHIYFFEAAHIFPTGYFQGGHVKYVPLIICIIPSCLPTDWLPLISVRYPFLWPPRVSPTATG